MKAFRLSLLAALLIAPASGLTDTTEFCLDGEFDLGARYQGMSPEPGEFYPARWCVTTDDDTDRVLLSMSGQSNPDMQGGWTVAFIPPETVRIVNRDAPPDIEFRTPKAADEARRTLHLDPRHAARPADPVISLRVMAELALRGRVPVEWTWRSLHENSPRLEIAVDGVILFRGTGSRRALDDDEAMALWQATPGAAPVQVPGDRWPSQVAMQLETLADGVHLVKSVRTGFHHMVVETQAGLVVADAPAGWVELHQFPPADLVPGLGISGLSERFVDFLAGEFPDTPIRAVALTHHHDDHAGGARAFAAAGADVYAPAESARFLASALNRDSMPADRFAATGRRLLVRPVVDTVTLGDAENPVELVSLGPGPHVDASLGVYAPQQGYFFQSDLHVPRSDADAPRAARAATECWFAAWAVDNLPPATLVINTHTEVETPVSRLARYLDSPPCSGPAGEP